jgi:hypothetical protein
MVILKSCSMKEKQNDRYDQSEVRVRRKMCRKCNKDMLTRRLEYRPGTCQNSIPW